MNAGSFAGYCVLVCTISVAVVVVVANIIIMAAQGGRAATGELAARRCQWRRQRRPLAQAAARRLRGSQMAVRQCELFDLAEEEEEGKTSFKWADGNMATAATW